MALGLSYEADSWSSRRRGLRGQAAPEAERVGPGPGVLVLVLIADVEDGVVGEEVVHVHCFVLLVPSMPLAHEFFFRGDPLYSLGGASDRCYGYVWHFVTRVYERGFRAPPPDA